MGSRVWIAIAAAVLVVVLPSAETATAGCSPNVAWQDRFPQWSPTGDRFVFLRETVACGPAPNDLVIADRSGRSIRSFHVVGAAAWSPDGRRLAFVDRSGLRITDPNGARTEAIGSGGTWLTWGAPGIALLRSGTLRVVDPGRAGERQVGAENRLRGPIAWTPTNEVVATRVERPGDDETMQLVRIGLDGTLTALTPASGRYGRMTVSGAAARRREPGRLRRPSVQRAVLGPRRGSILYAAGHECLRWGIYRAPATRLTNRCRFTGTTRADTLRGSPFLDYLLGREGRDRLVGGGGRDTIDGGSGDDVLDGGGDRDVLFGRGGADVLLAGGGPDEIRPGSGRDRVDAGRGNDVVHVRDGWRDIVQCGGGRGDVVVADRLDVLATDCERVERV